MSCALFKIVVIGVGYYVPLMSMLGVGRNGVVSGWLVEFDVLMDGMELN